MFVLLLILVWRALVIAGENETRVMRFVTSTLPESEMARISTLVLTEAFGRLGYAYEVRHVPEKRGIYMMKHGFADGDATRAQYFNKQHPYYILVNEHHSVAYASAFATDPNIKVSCWDDLKKGNYIVGYLAGVQFAERNLIGLIDMDKLIVQPTANINGLKQLGAGRTDVYVYVPSDQAKYDFATKELKDFKIIMAGHLDETKIYPYLQKKHEALADVLAEKIREIKAEGLFDEYQKQLGVCCEQSTTILN